MRVRVKSRAFGPSSRAWLIGQIVAHYQRNADVLRWVEAERRKRKPHSLDEKVQREAYRRMEARA